MRACVVDRVSSLDDRGRCSVVQHHPSQSSWWWWPEALDDTLVARTPSRPNAMPLTRRRARHTTTTTYDIRHTTYDDDRHERTIVHAVRHLAMHALRRTTMDDDDARDFSNVPRQMTTNIERCSCRDVYTGHTRRMRRG